MRELEHGVDRDLMLLVEHALDRHAERRDPEPLLAYEDGGRRRLLRLPATDDPSAAATEALLDTDERRRFRRAVVVWRTTLVMPGASPVPARYARAQVAGVATSSLFVQHYEAGPDGERPLGTPELVEVGPALRRPARRESSGDEGSVDVGSGIAGGAAAGLGAAQLAATVIVMAGPTSRESAVVVEDRPLTAELVIGETVDLSFSPFGILHPPEPGTTVTLVFSDLTDHPIGIESYGGDVGLLAAWTAFVIFLMVVTAGHLKAWSALRHRRSPRIAAAIAFVVGTVGFLAS
jgi:hypothetical protein